MQFSDFLAETEVLDLNIFKLIRYVEKSKLSHKLHGFYKTKMEKDAVAENTENKKGLSNFLKRVATPSTSPSTSKDVPKSTETKPISEENKVEVKLNIGLFFYDF